MTDLFTEKKAAIVTSNRISEIVLFVPKRKAGCFIALIKKVRVLKRPEEDGYF